jgi:hypothetical protein
MTEPTAKPPCCPVGAREDAAEVDAMLRAGATHRAVAAALEGLNPSAVYRHKQHLDGLETPDETRRETPIKTSETRTPPPKKVRPLTRTEEQDPFHRAEPAAVDPSAKVTADRIGAIANLIHFGSWRDRSTVVGLSERWGIPHEEVERLHRVAAAKVRSSRGSNVAQLESSIAVTRKMRDDELANAETYDKATAEAFKAHDTSATKTARKMATFARQMALAAQTHLDKITIIRPASIVVNVGVQAQPDFAKAWDVVRRLLDAKFQGASEHVDDGLSAWEDRGEEGLAEYLSNDDALVLSQNTDGSYG